MLDTRDALLLFGARECRPGGDQQHILISQVYWVMIWAWKMMVFHGIQWDFIWDFMGYDLVGGDWKMDFMTFQRYWEVHHPN